MEVFQSPNHKPWATERKNAAEERAARVGQLQKFVMASRLFPFAVVLVSVAVLGLAVGFIEHTF